MAATASVEQLALPFVAVAAVSPLTKPPSVAVRAGFGEPYSRDLSTAVTVRSLFVMVSVPSTKVNL